MGLWRAGGWDNRLWGLAIFLVEKISKLFLLDKIYSGPFFFLKFHCTLMNS